MQKTGVFMKQGIDRDKMILALHRAMLATFDESKWTELALLLHMDRVLISGPHNLLRSVRWRTDDYPKDALTVLRMFTNKDENLEKVVQFVNLEPWLRANDPDLHAEIYGMPDVIPLEEIEGFGRKLDIPELNQHASRIRSGIRSDPSQAIGSAKELLETVLKTVLGAHGDALAKDDMPALWKKAAGELGLDARSVDLSREGAEIIRRVLGSLSQIVVGVARVRTKYGTGHGRAKAEELEFAHALLVVNSAITLATFVLQVWQAREDQ